MAMPRCLTIATAVAVLLVTTGPAMAQGAPARDGEALYRGICQGCHMPEGQGAVGAARYPALAGNANLETGAYAVHLVVNGQRAMPSFGRLSDAEVAAVVNYIRARFAAKADDPVTADDVRAVRPVPVDGQGR